MKDPGHIPPLWWAPLIVVVVEWWRHDGVTLLGIKGEQGVMGDHTLSPTPFLTPHTTAYAFFRPSGEDF